MICHNHIMHHWLDIFYWFWRLATFHMVGLIYSFIFWMDCLLMCGGVPTWFSLFPHFFSVFISFIVLEYLIWPSNLDSFFLIHIDVQGRCWRNFYFRHTSSVGVHWLVLFYTIYLDNHYYSCMHSKGSLTSWFLFLIMECFTLYMNVFHSFIVSYWSWSMNQWSSHWSSVNIISHSYILNLSSFSW
jgi:hypothetical protein